ncbi:MAG: hypothetical protein K4H23_03550, partial [Mollicutes bacterium PWAP]|nr:hypothetical protein [Mollicutes bacterium PWAP]
VYISDSFKNYQEYYFFAFVETDKKIISFNENDKKRFIFSFQEEMLDEENTYKMVLLDLSKKVFLMHDTLKLVN